MTASELKTKLLEILEGVLNGTLDHKAASDTALKLIVDNDLRPLPAELGEIVDAVFDLHDGKEASWVPTRQELRKYKEQLEHAEY